MSMNRHFGKFTGGQATNNGEDVVILGHRTSENDVLVAFLAAMSIDEARELRGIVMSDEAQRRDYLMPVLKSAHHQGTGKDWQTFLISSMGRVTKKVTMKDIEFFDPTQKAFFGGYGPSIEPELDARRKARNAAQEAILTGQAMPEPTEAQIDAQMALQEMATTPREVEPVNSRTPKADPAMAMIAESMAALAAGQQQMAAAMVAMSSNQPAAKKPRKTTTRKPRVSKKTVTETAAAVVSEPVNESTPSENVNTPAVSETGITA